MKFGKRFARIGFLVGFIGPILFYPLHYQAQVLCPLCPYIFVPPRALIWLQIGLVFGLIQGLTFALLAFAIGYSISKVKSST